MRRITAIIAFLILAGVGCAADTYCSLTGDNGADGLTAETAYRDLDTAMANVGDGDTVYMVAGTYDDADDLGAGGQIDLDGWGGDAKSFTVKPYGGTVVLIPSAAAQAVLVDVDWPGETIAFEQIELQSTADTISAAVYYAADKRVRLEFINCVLDGRAKDLPVIATSTDTAAPSRQIYVRGGSLLSGDNRPIEVIDADVLSVDGCTITSTYASASDSVIYARTDQVNTVMLTDNTVVCQHSFFRPGAVALGSVFIANNTITLSPTSTATNAIEISNDSCSMADCRIDGNVIQFSGSGSAIGLHGILLGSSSLGSTYRYDAPKIRNNAITFDGGYEGTGVKVGGGCDGFDTTGNTVTNAKISYSFSASYGMIVNNVAIGIDGILLFGSRGCVIRGNTVKNRDTDTFNSRALMFARGELVPTETSSTFGATTVTGSGWDLSYLETDFGAAYLATGRVLCLAKDTDGSSYTHYGVVSGVDDATDVVTVDGWIKTDGTTETPTGTKYVDVVLYAEQNAVTDNILDAADASYCMTFDFNPVCSRNYIDYNCYRPGSSTLSNIGYIAGTGPTGTQTTLAALQAVWSLEEWTRIYSGNDAHSISTDPLLDAAGLAGSQLLRSTGSPALIGGDGALLLSNDIGATKLEEKAGPLYRTIYGD